MIHKLQKINVQHTWPKTHIGSRTHDSFGSYMLHINLLLVKLPNKSPITDKSKVLWWHWAVNDGQILYMCVCVCVCVCVCICMHLSRVKIDEFFGNASSENKEDLELYVFWSMSLSTCIVNGNHSVPILPPYEIKVLSSWILRIINGLG